MSGCFITFEGIDGAGKSTQIAALVAALRARGLDVEQTREPGGSPLAEMLRTLVLQQEMDRETEALLMFAARRDHLRTRIWPALAEGRWVVSDRFSDASYAYQVGGRDLPIAFFEALEQWVHPAFQPDLTILFDLSPALASGRISAAARNLDRFEQEGRDFHQRVRAAYVARAQADPQRFLLVDASLAPEEITAAVLRGVAERLP